MSAKSFAVWEAAKSWCKQHPGQKHQLVSHDGSFTLSWEPPPERERLHGVTYDSGLVTIATLLGAELPAPPREETPK